MTDISQASLIDEAHIQDHLRFALGILGIAGHTITDPYILHLAETYMRGGIDGDTFRELARNYSHSLYNNQKGGNDDD